MKGMELFDMLGEIDDKFFEEAAPPDTQHPVEITAEKRGLKYKLLSMVMPIAACLAIVAAIGIWIGFIGQNTFLRPNISLSEYTALDKENTQDIQPKVILDTKELDDYKILLLAHDVRNSYFILPVAGPGNHSFHVINFSRLFVVLEKDGKAVAQSDDLDIDHLDFDTLSEYIQPFDLKDGMGFALCRYGHARFYSRNGSKIKQLANTNPSEPYEDVDFKPDFTTNYENDTLINGGRIISINFSNSSYTITERVDLDGYLAFNKNSTELQPKVILDVKELKDYHIYLLGHDAKISVSGEQTVIGCSKLLLVLEKGSEVFDTIDAENMALDVNLIYNFIHPFEMKDGIGIAMFYRFDTWSKEDPYAMLYKIDNEMIIKLKSDSQPDYVSNLQHYCDADFVAISPQANEISTERRTMTINFTDNSYTVKEYDLGEIDIEEYLPYDKDSTSLQPKVILGRKSVGNYEIMLLGRNVTNGDYVGIDAVYTGWTNLVLIKDSKVVHVMESSSNCCFYPADDLLYYIKPFELSSGTGFVLYVNYETWTNSLSSCKAYIIKDDQMINVTQDRFMFIDPNFKTNAEENAIYDDEVKITIDFINNTFYKHNINQ